MLHLREKHIPTPYPIRTREGSLFASIEKGSPRPPPPHFKWNNHVEGISYNGYLLEFIPGKMLTEFRPHPSHLLYSLGRYLGQMDMALRYASIIIKPL